MKCYVVSNCTHAPIREYLSATGQFSQVDSVAIYAVPPDRLEEHYKNVREYDVVISTILYGDRWGPYEHGALRADLGDRVHLFDAPFFEGLHPDVVYMSLNEGRFQSPIGDYHSGLIYWGYRKGVPIPTLAEMYNDGELPDVFNPRESWERSLRTLAERENPIDLKIADKFEQFCREHPAMLTFNHPTMPIIAAQCDVLCERLFGNRARPIDPTTVYNDLLSDVIVPVSPATIKANDLPYRASPLFKFGREAPKGRSGYLDFQRFATLCYARYGVVDPAALQVTTPKPLADSLNAALAE